MLSFVKPEPLVDGLEIARSMQKVQDRQHADRANPKPVELKPLPEITDWHEAYQARQRFELMTDQTRVLRDACERQFELVEEIQRFEKILASNPTEVEVRQLCGYEAKTLTLPGELQRYAHVDGLLELKRAELEQLEKELPYIQRKAAQYEQLKKQLEPWPTYRIDRERRKEDERSKIVAGRAVDSRYW